MGARARGQAGQNLILVALGMVVFLGVVGLALDGGVAYLRQQDLQRAAEQAALAATSSYYRSNYAGNNGGFPASVSAGVTSARAAAAAVVAADGLDAGVMARPVLLDYQGNPLPPNMQCDPADATTTCPGATDVRGFAVSMSGSVPVDLLRVAGISQTPIGASAKAAITTPGGAAVPRFSADPSPCPGLPGDGIQ